ncbi:DUF3800 domain-containing protein [Fulvivirgaceae bacterium PWU4]|uniref:DUF3800 domain-containing protein n=1 Tax=Chryseosolibacter histidini TaxID=2782349 RepID=A0AAP2DPR7_9BACT|nr:DUF3800 domain-containing protein [Chryseosolibacter histidini]MBT1700276.1 DUF3800 domain-containing protein [Chryseosolibacter histidini]
MENKEIKTNHRFLDEAGDTTFYGTGKIPVIGNNGVSLSFILGLVKFRDPLEDVRQRIIKLQQQVQNDPYYKGVPSIQKKISKGNFYFHATDDPAEVRKTFFEFMREIDCSFEGVVARKIPRLYERKHNGNEIEFYADMLSHLLKNKFQKQGKLVLNIAQRGKSTRNAVLEMARQKAEKRFTDNKEGRAVKTEIVFNIQNHTTEPLLNIADYFCWALQRVFERGEIRYYEFLMDKIPVVVDLYDQENYEKWGNYYGPKRPLTAKNKISPPLH